MINISSKFAAATACTITALAASVINPIPALAIGFSFSQGGFDTGGTLQGNFSGEDLDNDNFLETDEVTSFFLSFTGDSDIPDFEQGLEDFSGFQLPLDISLGVNTIDFSTGDKEIPEGTVSVGGFVAVFPGGTTNTSVNFTDNDGGGISSVSTEEFKLVRTPESSSVVALVGFAALGLGAITKKRLSEKHCKVS